MKKFLSMILALAMVFSLAVPAMAAEGDTYTLYIDIGQVVDSTKEVSGVWLWANDGSSNLVNNEQISYVSGTVYSYSVPSAITGGRFSISYTDGSSSNPDYYFSIESAGKNLYTPTGEYTGTWSTYTQTEGDVTANYTPVITITDIALSEYEGNDSVTVDTDNKIYTITIPADADSTVVTVTVSGQNLDKITEGDYKVSLLRDIYDPLIADSCDPNTGTMSWSLNVYAINAGTTLKYSTDGGETWTETGWSTVIRKEYNVTVNDAENGTVTASSATAAEGETVELFVTAAEGYELETLTVKQGENDVTVNADHTFTMPAGDVTVTATFTEAATAYNITINESENGTVVAMEGEQQITSAHHNDDVTLVVTPADGYALDQLTVTNTATGEPVTVSENNTFVMPDGNVTVTATFKATYTITTSTTGDVGGSTISVPASAAEDDIVTVTLNPAEGYTPLNFQVVEDVNFFEVSFTKVNETTYTFVMPAQNVLIEVDFCLPGTTLDAIYYKGTWTNVEFEFTNSAHNYAGEVKGTMKETGIYEATPIPEWSYYLLIRNLDNEGETSSWIRIPNDKNMYNAETGEWETYTPSTPEDVTSASISWGSMSFTYTDGEDGAEGAWTADAAEKAGTVTVENTGTTAISVSATYVSIEEYQEIEGTLGDAKTLAATEKGTFTLTLSGKPDKAIPAGTKIGSVTVKIEEVK